MKNEKMKWYFLIAVALVVGAIIGYFATSNLATEGNAKAALKQLDTVDVYMDDVYVGPILKQRSDGLSFGCPCGCAGFYFPCDNPGGCLNCSCCSDLTPKK